MNKHVAPPRLTFALPPDELLRAVPEVVLLLDKDGRVLRSTEAHAGARLGQLDFKVGMKPHRSLHPRCRDDYCPFAEQWTRAWEEHKAGLPIEWINFLQDPEGVFKIRLQPVSYICSDLYRGHLDGYADASVAFVQDVTEHYSPGGEPRSRRATDRVVARFPPAGCTDGPERCSLAATFDERLNATTSRLLVAQESERRRIAAELHDSLGQTLSLLNFEIDCLLDDSAEPTGDSARAERIQRYVRRSVGELRRIIQNLRPVAISKLGLFGALETLCADFRAAYPSVAVECRLTGNETGVPEDVAVAAYRIAQEALNNIAKHADASEVSLTFSFTPLSARLHIRDDGIGLESGGSAAAGIGLETMAERTRILGGRFIMNSAPGLGCEIDARWESGALPQ